MTYDGYDLHAGGMSVLPSLTAHTCGCTASLRAADSFSAFWLTHLHLPTFHISASLVDDPSGSLHTVRQQLEAGLIAATGKVDLTVRKDKDVAGHEVVVHVGNASAWASNARLSIMAASVRSAAASLHGLLGDTPSLPSRVSTHCNGCCPPLSDLSCVAGPSSAQCPGCQMQSPCCGSQLHCNKATWLDPQYSMALIDELKQAVESLWAVVFNEMLELQVICPVVVQWLVHEPHQSSPNCMTKSWLAH